jgi:hypothetical protein
MSTSSDRRPTDLLGEAKRRLGTAPGFEFMRTHQVTVLAGSSAMASVLMGTGSEMQIWTRPRLVGMACTR